MLISLSAKIKTKNSNGDNTNKKKDRNKRISSMVFPPVVRGGGGKGVSCNASGIRDWILIGQVIKQETSIGSS